MEAKPRLILFIFTTTQLKWDILKQARLLRNTERCANIFISPDLTRAEREWKNTADWAEKETRGSDTDGVLVPENTLSSNNTSTEDAISGAIGGETWRQ